MSFISLSLSAFPLSLSRFIAKLLLCSDVARRTYGIFIMFPVVLVLVVWSFDFSCTTRYPPTPPAHTRLRCKSPPRLVIKSRQLVFIFSPVLTSFIHPSRLWFFLLPSFQFPHKTYVQCRVSSFQLYCRCYRC